MAKVSYQAPHSLLVMTPTSLFMISSVISRRDPHYLRLITHVSKSSPFDIVLAHLASSVALEQEARDEFPEVTLRQGHPMRIPVSLEIATNHLRVTTVKHPPDSLDSYGLDNVS